MGAPTRMPLDLRILPGSFEAILIGCQVEVRDIPRERLVTNITATKSDPNYLGAYDYDTVEYDREIDIEVVKFLAIARRAYPECYHEDMRQVTLKTTVYQTLGFGMPEEERTDEIKKKAFDEQTAQYAENLKEYNGLIHEKAVYIAYKSGECNTEPIGLKRDIKKIAKKLDKDQYLIF